MAPHGTARHGTTRHASACHTVACHALACHALACRTYHPCVPACVRNTRACSHAYTHGIAWRGAAQRCAVQRSE
eukprot:10689269-Lingulodinium_polyedra.AAC.1